MVKKIKKINSVIPTKIEKPKTITRKSFSEELQTAIANLKAKETRK